MPNKTSVQHTIPLKKLNLYVFCELLQAFDYLSLPKKYQNIVSKMIIEIHNEVLFPTPTEILNNYAMVNEIWTCTTYYEKERLK